MKITQTTNINYPIPLLEIQTRLLFKNGIMGFIAYSRFNYSLEDLRCNSFKNIAKDKQYNYVNGTVFRMKSNKKNTTNYFSVAELKELESLFTKEYNNIIQQNKKILYLN